MSDARPSIRLGLLSERSDFFGGGQRSLCDLAAALRGSRVEPLVVLPGAGPLAAALEAEGIGWVGVPLAPAHAWGAPAFVRSLLRLTEVARGRQLDLLHSDSPRTALYAGLAALALRRRHVWHVRASRTSSPLGDRVLVALSDAVIAVSAAAARRTRALRVSPKVRVVPTGLPRIDFLERGAARAALGLPGDPFIAGVIGRVEPEKGADVALAALPALRAAVPGALLAFVGPGEIGGSDGRIGRSRAVPDPSEAALFLGERREAAPLMRAFDVILHPSRHDALPRVLIEAMFAGVPVVASSVGGIPEMIESGRSGILVPGGDPHALAVAAVALARDPALRSRLAEGAMRRASMLFGIDAMLRDILAVYAEVIPFAAGPPLRAREVTR